MKKKSFLSGIGAKLALAAVALTTVMFTSCEEEKFNVEPVVPVELAPASATIMATVYDQTTGVILGTSSETISANADGVIAATTKPVPCPVFSGSEEYLPVEAATVSVPEVKKGQMVLIPVNFYALKITSAAKNVVTSKDEDSVKEVSSVATTATEGIVGTGVPQEVEVEALTGTKVLNKTAIYADIENLVNSRAAMSNENVIKVLKSVVDVYDNQRTVTKTVTITIPKGATVNVKPVTAMTEYEMDIKATVDAVEYTIPGVKIKEAGATTLTLETVSHGHGHGDSENAGGGAGGK